MNTDVKAQAMAALRERCKALQRRMDVDAMLGESDPVETLFSFAVGMFDVGFNAGWEECEAKAAKPLEPTQREADLGDNEEAIIESVRKYDTPRDNDPRRRYTEMQIGLAIRLYARMTAAQTAPTPQFLATEDGEFNGNDQNHDAKPDHVEDAVRAEREAIARLIDAKGVSGCERGSIDHTTGTFECRALDRGECNCSDFDELAEAIRARLP